jgi:hypothetical protein
MFAHLPPIITDAITTATASLLPPPAEGPYDQDGVFTYDALKCVLQRAG